MDDNVIAFPFEQRKAQVEAARRAANIAAQLHAPSTSPLMDSETLKTLAQQTLKNSEGLQVTVAQLTRVQELLRASAGRLAHIDASLEGDQARIDAQLAETDLVLKTLESGDIGAIMALYAELSEKQRANV